MSGDLEANKEALDGITRGINATIGELKSIGTPGEAAVGRGFSELSLSGLESGHEGLTSALDDFCDRWEWGIRALLQDANAFAERVHLSAGYYHEVDSYLSGTMKVVANAGMGNPHLSEEQVGNMSWGQVASDNAFTQARDADFSAGSVKQQAQNAERVWSRTADDLMDSAETGGATPMGVAFRTARKLNGGGEQG
ncbi:hypothetical protein ACFY2W_31195 [Streptomyces sp. NPDC001262]|uniref:hypothetical protein n=1 Tax=Streptomyces sp. NPDC001262 TaxID=3364552 RepID=UPI00368B9CBF